ncbi:MAG: hypothetical protein Tsb0020_02320 [Haliangiales bacterium]
MKPLLKCLLMAERALTPRLRPRAALLGALLVLALSGCGQSSAPPAPAPVAPDDAAVPALPADATRPMAPARLAVPAGQDDDDVLQQLGALPAWEAVVARGRLLHRREQHGVVYGRLGAPVAEGGDPHERWLVDETEAEGALAIRVRFDPERVILPAQARVAVWGAWAVDEGRQWYWRATRVATLAPATAELPLSPGFALPTIAEAPADAVPISTLESGGQVLFEVRANPEDPTAGWDVRDPGGERTVARLLLPGEHPAYGGMDYRTADEHWKLTPRVLYTVPARRFRHTQAGDLPLFRARGVPRQVVAP